MTTPFINSLSLSASPCLWKDFTKTQAHLEMCLLPCDRKSDSKVQELTGQRQLFVSKYCHLIGNEQERHTNLLSQRFAQSPKLAVIPDCLTAEKPLIPQKAHCASH